MALYQYLGEERGQSGICHRDWSIEAMKQSYRSQNPDGVVLRRIQHVAHQENDQTSCKAKCDFVASGLCRRTHHKC